MALRSLRPAAAAEILPIRLQPRGCWCEGMDALKLLAAIAPESSSDKPRGGGPHDGVLTARRGMVGGTNGFPFLTKTTTHDGFPLVVRKGGFGRAVARWRMAEAIAFYATCSSTMLVLNKLAVHHIQAPSFVMFCQMVTTTCAVFGGSRAGWIEPIPFTRSKVRAFIWVVAIYAAMQYSKLKILQHANVETFIVFRSSTPILVAFLDFAFLGRCLPSPRSCAVLVLILLAAMAYIHADSHFEVRSYAWACAWYVLFCAHAIYVKHVCTHVELPMWGRVCYQACITAPFSAAFFVLGGEGDALGRVVWGAPQIGYLALSCAGGIAMAYSAFLLRSSVSATSFTVVGVICKIAAVVINLMVWDSHATPAGLIALFVCLGSGTLYREAPRRRKEAGMLP